MAMRTPSSRKSKGQNKRLNLVPILDSVFIFIFFLLMSASFMRLFEIPSDIPIISSEPPKNEKKKPLSLTLKIFKNKSKLYSGVPSRLIKTFNYDEGNSHFENLKLEIISIKKNHLSEKTILFEPEADVDYELIVKMMDAVRVLRSTDESIFIKDENNLDVKIKTLFDNIVFSNIKS